jgi:hypothetical protein
MLQPAPTTTIDPSLARGTLRAFRPPHEGKPGAVTLTFPNTSYESAFVAAGTVKATAGQRIVGTIRAEAQRVDIVKTGGRYIEPVYGPPRRIQGTVVTADNAANTLTINASVPFVCKLTDQRQRAMAFEPGQMVTCELRPGASFTERLPQSDG